MNGPICYCILVHRDSLLLRQLMARLLEDSRSTIVIHVDGKTKGLVVRLSKDYQVCGRVRIFSSHKVHWGHYSMCLAMVGCIEEALRIWPDSGRIVFLSGQHFLLSPVVAINNFFDQQPEAEFMEQYCMLTHRWIVGGPYKRRYSYYWPFRHVNGFHHVLALTNKLCGVRREIPYGHHPYSGSQWMSITGRAARILADELGRPEISEFYSKTLIPDEMLFHTILGNSEVKTNIRNTNLNYIRWNKNGTPKVLTVENLDELYSAAKSGLFFTRKLDPARSKELFKKLDSELSHAVSRASVSSG
ncbi:beta-1,6-N-acetylglucosaminyltransferase [Pseudomonadota bacterium]